MMLRPPIDAHDPPQLAGLILLGVVAAFAGILIGLLLAVTPLGLAGFFLGCGAAPLIAGASAWRQGTNGVGVATAVGAGLVALAAVAWAVSSTSVAP